MNQGFRFCHFLLLRTHNFLFRLAHFIVLNSLCALSIYVLYREIFEIIRRSLLILNDHMSRVDTVQSYSVRNWSLLLDQRGRMPNLRLLGDLNLLQFDIIPLTLGAPTILFYMHYLVSVKIHDLFVHILCLLLLRTRIIDCLKCKIFLRYIFSNRCIYDFISVIDLLREPNYGLRFYSLDLC